MTSFITCGFLFAYLLLPGVLHGEVIFRCPSCTAERLAECAQVTTACAEIVREPGCGCCPVCARMEGEPCGVYTPRCASSLRCYPSMGEDFPLQQLIHGFGRCGPKVDDMKGPEATLEGHGADPETKRPTTDTWVWYGYAQKQHLNEGKTKMKANQPKDPWIPKVSQTVCEQELDQVLEKISKMTPEDNRGQLENLKFPNCDVNGLFNLKQCNISTHGQRGECWCVNPLTGVQIPTTPKVRGDPNCNQFHEELMATPATSAAY
ncbi:insulin-like growth factor-binding protein 2-A [Neosynchiropus ocellatus]